MSRGHKLLRLVRSPSELWLLWRMALWASVVPVLKRALPLPRVVRLLASTPRRRERDAPTEQRVIAAAARLYRSRFVVKDDNCLERSLVTYRYLTRVNAKPRLVVGMGKRPEVVGHVWVTVDGTPVHDDDETLAGLTPVAEFGPDGERATG